MQTSFVQGEIVKTMAAMLIIIFAEFWHIWI
jgi:hypothetical protein